MVNGHFLTAGAQQGSRPHPGIRCPRRRRARRGSADRRPTADEVVTVAREEFAALIDPGQARAALATWGRGDG